MDLNKVMIIGNITNDLELKTTPSGLPVLSFSVATNLTWKDQSGSKQEKAEFHNVVAWRKLAETIAQYLKKGSSILVEGRLQTKSWEADGVKKYKTEIVAEKVQFGPKRDGGSGNYNNKPAETTNGEKEVKSDGIDYPTEEINPEDIPF